jgi:hypothetical protein
MMQGEPPSTFNLYQALILFMDRASRGGRFAVPREEFVRNLHKFFPGVSYRNLMDALLQLENRGLVRILWAGPENFSVTMTPASLNIVRNAAQPRAAVPPAPPPPPPPPPGMSQTPPVAGGAGAGRPQEGTQQNVPPGHAQTGEPTPAAGSEAPIEKDDLESEEKAPEGRSETESTTSEGNAASQDETRSQSKGVQAAPEGTGGGSKPDITALLEDFKEPTDTPPDTSPPPASKEPPAEEGKEKEPADELKFATFGEIAHTKKETPLPAAEASTAGSEKVAGRMSPQLATLLDMLDKQSALKQGKGAPERSERPKDVGKGAPGEAANVPKLMTRPTMPLKVVPRMKSVSGSGGATPSVSHLLEALRVREAKVAEREQAVTRREMELATRSEDLEKRMLLVVERERDALSREEEMLIEGRKAPTISTLEQTIGARRRKVRKKAQKAVDESLRLYSTGGWKDE